MIMEFHISWRHRSRLCSTLLDLQVRAVLWHYNSTVRHLIFALFHVDGSTVFDESGCVSKYQTHVTAARNKTGLSADLSLN